MKTNHKISLVRAVTEVPINQCSQATFEWSSVHCSSQDNESDIGKGFSGSTEELSATMNESSRNKLHVSDPISTT